MNLNILLRGQSNAIILGEVAGADAVAAEVQKLLGFDGINDTVTLLFKEFDGSGSSTAASGTALLGEWLTPPTAAGQPWTAGTYERALLNYVNGLSTTVKSDPTVVLWLHNEYDSADPTLTAATWSSAVRDDAALLRAAFLGPVSYVFVEPIPLSAGLDAGAQAIRTGMEALVADSGFNARLTASTDDLVMDGVFRDAAGHMSSADAALVADRAARSIAEVFATFAKPGSALASGNIDDTGPIAVGAQQTGTREVTVSLQFDGATSLKTLDLDAATGIGWKAIAGSTVLDATGVSLGANKTLVVSFGADLPTGARIYYGYGDTHLVGTTGNASGNAIYDDQGMPLRSPAVGLLIGATAVQPGATLVGTDEPDNIGAGPNGDTIIGGKGDDFLVGGAGADTFVVSLGDGLDFVQGFTPGQDHIKFGVGITASNILVTPLNLGVDGLGVIYGSGGDGLFLAGVTALQPGDLLYSAPAVLPPTVQTGTDADEQLVAGASGDTLIGGKGNDYLIGGAGADEFRVSIGDGLDWVDGFTPGKDHIKFGPGITASDWRADALNLNGTDGLAVYYGKGTDALFLAGVTALLAGDVTYSPPVVLPPTLQIGTSADDDMAAGDSGDTLIGGAGTDYMVGGAGADVFGFQPGDGPDWVAGFTPGTDRLLFGGGLTLANVTVSADVFLGVSGLFVRYGAAVEESVFLADVAALQQSDITFGPLPVSTPSSPPVVTSAATANFAENGTGPVYTATATDPNAGTTLSYSLSGADAALFTINGSSGVIAFKAAPDFEAPADAGANNVYDVNVVVSNGTLTGSKALAINVTNVDEGPRITSPASATTAENVGTNVTVYTATGTDPENDTIAWSISGGADAALFKINAATGAVSFAASPNFEAPADAGANNVYDITIQALANGKAAVQNLAIAVTDVNELPGHAAPRDFDGSGATDILWRGANNEVVIWQMNGSQIIGAGSTPNPGSYWSIAGTGDFNGDGHADILWRGQGAEVVIWEMGGSQIVGGGSTPNPGNYWSIAGTGDFNGDGRTDILWRGQGAEVAIWEMDGSQIVGGGSTPNPGSYWSIAGTGDFNGDGRTDILWRGQGAEVVVWEMDGSQIIGGGSTPNPGSYWSIAGTGDFNGDGRTDILWRGQGAEVVVWEMDGSQIISAGSTPNPGSYWSIAGTGDFNGDGRTDILWRGQGAEVVVWEMDGSQIVGGGSTPNPGSYWTIAG